MKKRLDEVPITKKSGIMGIDLLGGGTKIEKKENYLQQIQKEIDKAEEQERPINGEKIQDILDNVKSNDGQFLKQSKIRGNCLFLITGSGELIFYENVKAGKLKITRKDGKTAVIDLPKQKLNSMRYGDQEVPVWVAYENELVALPSDTRIDSALAYQNIEEIISNRKNFEAQTINAWSNFSWQLIVGFIVVIIILAWGVPVLTGKPVLESLGIGVEKEETPQVQQPTTTMVSIIPEEEMRNIAQGGDANFNSSKTAMERWRYNASL